MTAPSPFTESRRYAPGGTLDCAGVLLPETFAEPADELSRAQEGAALFDRSDRALLRASGRDRKAWLHNLVTNAVTNLDPHSGVYAFAVNVKGRILFDLDIICLPDELLLALHRSARSTAAAHFDRHLFSEEVRIEDVTGQYAVLACSGPQADALARALGVGNFAALPALAHAPVGDAARLVRHDIAGAPAFELIVLRGQAPTWWDRLAELGAQPAGFRTLDLLRIEAGIPWFGRDFDDRYLPPETGQVERGISYHKGCYLGQEVIERMRSRGGLARRLVKLRLPEGAGLDPPVALMRDGAELGEITSLVRHPSRPYWPGLGYLKTTVTGFADLRAGDQRAPVTICSA